MQTLHEWMVLTHKPLGTPGLIRHRSVAASSLRRTAVECIDHLQPLEERLAAIVAPAVVSAMRELRRAHR